MHVIAHGGSGPDDLGFWSDDEESTLNLTELAETFAEDGEGIESPVLFADCCGTAQGRFTRAIRDCIEQPLAYIGARRMVSWHECRSEVRRVGKEGVSTCKSRWG